MQKTYSHNGITWIDVEAPSVEDIRSIVKAYKLHPIIGEELLGPSKSSKSAVYRDYIYLVLIFPIRVRTDGHHEIQKKEIDFVIGRDFIITAHYEVVQPLHAFARAFEANSILDKESKTEHAGYIFYHMLRRIYAHMLGELESIHRELEETENQIFKGREKATVESISNLSREIIDFRQISRLHYEILESLEKSSKSLYNDDFAPYIGQIKDDFVLIRDSILNSNELAKELRDTNDSLLNSKQNDIIKVLTLVSFVLYPPSFIAWIFSIPAVGVPLVERAGGWWALVAVMVAVGIAQWTYFKYKKWL